ncbi:hypothetical protein GOV14_06850 [Candidatus Pacearchaeota archaeon]|nr:hypothetical protein [Candidatus Pacearchaeota archaeon]
MSLIKKMIRKVQNSDLDSRRLSEINIKIENELDEFDFSKVVVRKPWGHEYLAYREEGVSIWILHIKKDAATSTHCHLDKRTDLLVLSGHVVCTTLEKKIDLVEGDLLILNKKVFHSTKAASESVLVMEIEFPSKKTDLVRLNDSYGREKKGYEKQKDMCFDLSEYQRVFLNGTDLNRMIGNMNLSIEEFDDIKGLKDYLKRNDSLLDVFITGEIRINNDESIISVGDALKLEDLKQENIEITKPIKVLNIKKNILDFD